MTGAARDAGDGPASPAGGGTGTPLQEAIAGLERDTGSGTVSLGELLDALEQRSLGFVLAALGILVLTPGIGAIPGVPDIASAAALLAIGHAWLGGGRRFVAPERLRARRVSADRVDRALEAVRPLGARIDRLVINERLAWLAESRGARIALSLTAALLALAVFALSLVPWLAALPAFGLLLVGLALMGEDGVFALLAHLATLASLVAAVETVGWLL